jgi:penicillin amidase
MIIPTGISGIPASDFFCNQSEMYVNNQYMEDLFTRERVEANKQFKAVFTGN